MGSFPERYIDQIFARKFRNRGNFARVIWNAGLWIAESTVWNPESKTALDYILWGEARSLRYIWLEILRIREE